MYLHILTHTYTHTQEAPIWEITGAEFTHSTTHTADGISIRFPRVTRIRDDKDWTNATSLERLKVHYQIVSTAVVTYMYIAIFG